MNICNDSLKGQVFVLVGCYGQSVLRARYNGGFYFDLFPVNLFPVGDGFFFEVFYSFAGWREKPQGGQVFFDLNETAGGRKICGIR